MSLEYFRLIDDTVFDNSITKRIFSGRYHQHGANLTDSDKSIDFIFGENNN